MSDKRMAKALLPSNHIEPGTQEVIMIDLAGRRFPTRAPWGVDKLTMANGPCGAFLFLKTDDRDPLSGARIFRQADPLQLAPGAAPPIARE
jgi:hypothetical protein